MLHPFVNRRQELVRAAILVGACWGCMGNAECSFADAEAESALTDPAQFFWDRVEPVLAEHCYACHSRQAPEVQGGLRLDSPTLMRRGGESGPAIVSGKGGESLLLSALRHEAIAMPPDKKLDDALIADIALWIDHGAVDPRRDLEDVANASQPLATERAQRAPASAGGHWAFQAPSRPAPPSVERADWARTEIDRFVLARLESAQLLPSPDASARALLRRVSYDLTGLSPSYAQLVEFERHADEAAYARVVDQLLSSPRFGERWGRHWLDVARYADTKGYVFQEDRNYAHAYKYRDWVIAAFNADMPYDQFVIAQLAGDQTGGAEVAAASGFLTLGRRFLNNKADIIDDRLDVVGRGLMGLTVGCARCHDHKYDPIPTADYYALYGVFANSEERPRDDLPPALVDASHPVEQAIFLRGNPGAQGPRVPRRFLTCLSSGRAQDFQYGSGRRELAERIACRDNPLTARVWANRVWGRLLGRGLVATPSDFGVRGESPTHPDLLDWLACTLADDGWSTKRLIRRIVMSSVYRQASDWRRDGAAVDVDNALLWRMNRRRLDLEAMRDGFLAAAERLDFASGGPAVQLIDAKPARRRAVYGFIERQNLPAFFRTFDFANPNLHVGARPHSTSPTQALFLLNNPFVWEQAQAVAAMGRNAHSAGKSDPVEEVDDAVQRIFRAVFARDPAEEELLDAFEFLRTTPSERDVNRQGVAGVEFTSADRRQDGAHQGAVESELDRVAQLAQALLLSNEFFYVD